MFSPPEIELRVQKSDRITCEVVIACKSAPSSHMLRSISVSSMCVLMIVGSQVGWTRQGRYVSDKKMCIDVVNHN